jgi:hypothetical protein
MIPRRTRPQNIEGLPFGTCSGRATSTFVLLAVVPRPGCSSSAPGTCGASACRSVRVGRGRGGGVAGFRARCPTGARTRGRPRSPGHDRGDQWRRPWTDSAGMTDLLPVQPAGPTTRERIAARIFAPRIRATGARRWRWKGGRCRASTLSRCAADRRRADPARLSISPSRSDILTVHHARTGLEFLQHWSAGESTRSTSTRTRTSPSTRWR